MKVKNTKSRGVRSSTPRPIYNIITIQHLISFLKDKIIYKLIIPKFLMIKNFNDFNDFKKEVSKIEPLISIESLVSLDLPYMEEHENCTIIIIPNYDSENSKIILFLSKDNIIIFSKETMVNHGKKFQKILKKQYGESTIITFLFFKEIVKKYFREFEKIRAKMNLLDLDPIIEEIENSGRSLRLLTDRLEALIQILIDLKENELKEFNINYIQFEYDLLMARNRYELERCRSHMYRIASLRTKAEMKSSSDLNTTMKRLTVIMTFLTIVSIVVSVPGTIGAILGIPALSNTYFESYTDILVWVLIGLTLLSVLLGYLYWKSLKMDK